MYQFVLGIDEVGRGPLAGPVAIGVSFIPSEFNWELLKGVTDSKKLSPAKREQILKKAKQLRKQKLLDFSVAMVSAKQIDEKGIVDAIRVAMKKALRQIKRRYTNVPPDSVLVQLDGGLYAPSEYRHQRTIIRGDQTEQVIGLASIVAKVSRDQYMVRLSEIPEYQAYQFGVHKGYGTTLHRRVLKEIGPSSQHRVSFCRKILVESS